MPTHLCFPIASLNNHCTGTLAKLVDWLINYKTADGKPQNSLLGGDTAAGVDEALNMIETFHARWQALVSGEVMGTGFYVGVSNGDGA